MVRAAGPVVLGLAALVCACEDEADESPPASSTAGSAAPAASATSTAGATMAMPAADQEVTPPKQAIDNLNRGIAQLERVLAERPDDWAMRRKLVGHLIRRARFLGTVEDYDRVAELAAYAPDADTAESHRLRARSHGALHRFDEALAELDAAEERGVSPQALEGPRSSLLLGLGRYEEALRLARRARTREPRTGRLAIEAVILGRMGRRDEAARTFVEAEKAFRGLSALELAWLYFERASMWHRAGAPEKAERFYRAAVERFPRYAHAVGHLAAMLPDAEAEPLLERIVKSATDPAYLGMLGQLRNRTEPGSGDALVERAKEGYDALLEAQPLAFADHAGWFYLSIDAPDRAVEVAERNLENRPVPEAFELAIAALLATRETDEACRLADRVMGLSYPSPSSKRAAADAYEACGKELRTAEIRESLGAAPEAHVH